MDTYTHASQVFCVCVLVGQGLLTLTDTHVKAIYS